jgi:peptidoglycan/xylan/chitin deacetylase (PgdA/CDA1 family)
MRFVSPLLKRAIYPALHHSGLLRRVPPTSECVVVNYHGVVPAGNANEDAFLDGNLVRPEALRQQLRYLKRHFQVIAPEDFRSYIERGEALPPRSVLITCDDGLLNTLTDVLPVLSEEKISCLFFVMAASTRDEPGVLWYEELYHLMRSKPLGQLAAMLPTDGGSVQAVQNFQAEWWSAVERASRLTAEARADWMAQVRAYCGPQPVRSDRRYRLLNAGELRQLADAGMTIGAHTRTHPVLSLASEEEARREIVDSKAEIERVLERPVWAFAYPFGNPATMGEREFRIAQAAEYSCAFLNVERWAGEESNPFAIARTHVTTNMMLPEFAAHVSGVHLRLQRMAGGG